MKFTPPPLDICFFLRRTQFRPPCSPCPVIGNFTQRCDLSVVSFFSPPFCVVLIEICISYGFAFEKFCPARCAMIPPPLSPRNDSRGLLWFHMIRLLLPSALLNWLDITFPHGRMVIFPLRKFPCVIVSAMLFCNYLRLQLSFLGFFPALAPFSPGTRRFLCSLFPARLFICVDPTLVLFFFAPEIPSSCCLMAPLGFSSLTFAFTVLSAEHSPFIYVRIFSPGN